MRLRVDTIIGGVLLASCVSPSPPQVRTAAVRPVRYADASVHGQLHDTVRDTDYVPAGKQAFEQTGLASWYGNEMRGRATANGERFDPERFTAAHRTLPMPSYVEVTSLDSGRTVLVRVNDRGPYHGNRVIDLSLGAARKIGITGNGALLVHIRRVDPPESARRALRQGQPVGATTSLDEQALTRLRERNNWSAPVSTRPTIPAGSGPYFIRVGTFSSKSRADALAGQIDADIVESGGLYQVRLGPYADADKVNAALAPLAAKGYPDVRIVR